MSTKKNKAIVWLRSFFFNYLWLGVVLVLISIIIDLERPAGTRSLSLSIFINLIQSIGLAVLISAIFSYASGTSEFVEKIQKLLEEIVVRRNFLANIDPEGKKEALKALIQPTAAEKNKYPNIGDYYGHFINKTLEIGSRCVRSNYQINSRAFFDKSKQRIATESMYSYRLYPSNDGFNDITVGFEEEEDGQSYCSYVSVSTPDGKRTPFEKIELKPFDQGGDISRRANISVKEIAGSANHLDVELKITEYGSERLALVTFKALQPTDGFRFHLRCDEGVSISEHAIFVVGASYYLDYDKNDGKWITIGCNQWINEGSGLSILVSMPYQTSQDLPLENNDGHAGAGENLTAGQEQEIPRGELNNEAQP